MTSDHSEATLSPAESHELETNVPLAAAAEITTDGNLEDPSENITSSEMNPEGDCVDMEMCRDNAVPVLSVDSAVNAEADKREVTASRALLVESDELETNIPVAAEVLTDGNLEGPPENVTTSELNPAGDCVDMNRGDAVCDTHESTSACNTECDTVCDDASGFDRMLNPENVSNTESDAVECRRKNENVTPVNGNKT